MCASSKFECLGDWLRDTRAELPTDPRQEPCTSVGFPARCQRFTGELAAQLPDRIRDMGLDELMDHLRAVPAEQFRLIALRALA